ncbi:MAG: Asp-tRNA(Asn)/Glu-tRNA(Gln) amidotransferase subunit GatB [Candidatus Pacebacteria bacterium]|nr:Asp-tRNA(Asn)/Glu-tRNA(Gln) amidotransferase subunit GatB [Candidatus Paceibacterota bacterium]
MYKTTIGLEIHFEAKTKSKMFCSCYNEANSSLEEKPNTNICPICTGQPGAMPVINEEAINKVIMAGLALDCEIAKQSKFDRKNYFYPDLPKGYQISQYDLPICNDGFLDISLGDGRKKRIRITRVHMEEDTAKLFHAPDGPSLVDFNRSGVPLFELVTEPDINSAEEAKKFSQELQLIFRYLDISNADMEKGQMRCEVNISLNKEGDKELGIKVEIKNLNSFKAVEKSIEYEIKRQADLLDRGEKIVQETRGWHDDKQITISQRGKENAHEYRYFPEPDLPPLEISAEKIEEIKSHMPELPSQKRTRFAEEYSLAEKNIEFFIRDEALAEYFEKVVTELNCWKNETEAAKKQPAKSWPEMIKLAANYIISDLQSMIKADKAENYSAEYVESKITPENFGEFICMISMGQISSKIAKIVLLEMFKTGADPSHIIEEKGLSQIESDEEISKIIDVVLEKNKKAVEDFKNGKQNSFAFLIGQIMAESNGKANPEKSAELLKTKLK